MECRRLHAPKFRSQAQRFERASDRNDMEATVPHTRTSTPNTRVGTFKAAPNNRASECSSSGEFAEQTPRGKKIDSLKAFGEPVVNPFQQPDGLPLPALISPQSGEIHRRPQLPGERALLARQ